MCGRFTQHYTWAEINAFLDLTGPARNLRPRYNIAPTTTIDVARAGDGGRELVPMRWGLGSLFGGKSRLTSFPRPSMHAPRRSSEKPMFRSAFRSRRCIIPASGFLRMDRDRRARRRRTISRRRRASPQPSPGFMGELRAQRSGGKRRNNAFRHHHRQRRERMDDALPRPRARHARTGKFRRYGLSGG